MNKTVLIWLVLVGVLTMKSFHRPAYAVGLYMMTFFAHPKFWWWGDVIEGYRWNFFAGVLLLGTLVLTNSRATMTKGSPLTTKAVPILLFMVVNAVAVHMLFAVNPDSSMGWLTNRLKFILFFFLLQYAIRDEEDFKIVAVSMALGMGYVGYEATINERGSFSGGRLEGIGAAGVTSSNHLASLLITALPLATTALFTNATRWVKGVTIICCAMTFNVVLMCNSRGAFLGVILGAVVFIIMTRTGPARKQSRRLIALALLGTFVLLGDPEITRRFMTTFAGDTARDTSAQSRIVFWTAASGMLKDYPLGSGGNSFSEGRGWRYMPRAKPAAQDTRAIHNGFLTEAVDWGVQGFAVTMLFLWAVWRMAWRGRRVAINAHDVNGTMVFACIAASLAAWMVSSVFGDYLNDEWGFWTAAMAYAYYRVHSLAEVTEPASVNHHPAPLEPLSAIRPRQVMP